MIGNKMDFSSCAIWTGFHKSSHIWRIVSVTAHAVSLLNMNVYAVHLNTSYIH